MKTIVMFLAAMLMVGPGMAMAQSTPAMGHEHKGAHHEESVMAGKGVNLTQDQRAQLRELRRKFTEETAQAKGAILTRKLELKALWQNPQLDSKAIMAKEKELIDLDGKLKERKVQLRLDAMKVYTPDQLATFRSHGWMGHRHGRRRMMGAGHEPATDGGMVGHRKGHQMGHMMKEPMTHPMGRMGMGSEESSPGGMMCK
jgi:Spy/CpxP family protein refolding chaperone